MTTLWILRSGDGSAGAITLSRAELRGIENEIEDSSGVLRGWSSVSETPAANVFVASVSRWASTVRSVCSWDIAGDCSRARDSEIAAEAEGGDIGSGAMVTRLCFSVAGFLDSTK